MSDILKISGAIRVGKLASAPSGAETGLIYFDTTLGQYRLYDGAAFQEIVDQSMLDALVAVDIGYSNATSGLTATDVQAAIDEIEGRLDTAESDINTVETSIANHLADATDAHDASAISSVAAGNLAATDVQSALNELQSDIDTRALDSAVIKKDGSVAFTASQSMGGFRLTSVASPVDASDAATKGYVDAIQQGLDVKASVRVASTANIDLSTGGLLTIDGISLSVDDRVLVKNQSTGSENGIYLAKSGSWVRASDADVSAEVTPGMFAFVEEGTVNADSGWVLTTDAPIVLGTTALVFAQFSGAGAIVGGNGLTKTGNTLDVNVDDSTIEIAADTLRVKDAGIVEAKIASAAVTDAKVATGIDAAKLADGSVSNTEFQYLNGVTSSIQTQLDAKLDSVSEDTAPSLGGNLTLGANVIIHNGDGMKRGSSSSDFLEEEYIHSVALSSAQTNAVISALTFAHASFEGLEMVYKVKESTSNDVKIGTVRVVTNGSSVVLSDVGVETADTGISFSAAINGANVEIRYSSGANGATLRADVKRIKA